MTGDLGSESTLTRIEEDVRRFWRRYEVPEAFRASRRDGLPYIIYQQPLAAWGRPKDEWVRLLAASDLLARYRTMQGDAVRRQVGWACHGLAVELAVEQGLGADLAGHDLAQFNDACREAAMGGVQQGELVTERLGVWLDPGDAYLTLDPQAVGAVWADLQDLWEAGRLKQENRVVPVCPRCATPLSAAEATQRATVAEAREVWVQLPWGGEPNTYLLAWTPNPWMLVGMVAVAAHPGTRYVLVELPGQEGLPPNRLLLSESALGRALLGDYQVVRYLSGKSLRGTLYHPPFTFVPSGEGIHRVVLSEDVPLDQGSGLWPVTPAFDALSLALARSFNLAVPDLLDDWGSLGDTVMPWRGLSPLDAEPLLLEDLQARGLVFLDLAQTRPLSFCPFCAASLIPQARDVWLVETAGGPWVVGRDRAWGCPLPIWGCAECGEQLCLAGIDDLAHRVGMGVGQIDVHRPAVDRLTFPCAACGGTMRRVPEVVDSAFEAAVLPWAMAPPSGPANLAVGLGDKHLGWLGDLTEMAALLRGSLAWQQAVAVPRSEPEEFWDLERIPSADALRWATYAGTTPEEAARDLLRPLWRHVVLYTSAPGLQGDAPERPVAGGAATDDELYDRWLLARLYQATGALTEALDACDLRRGCDILADLVRDLTDWYMHHRPGGGVEVVRALSLLLAPFAPHLAEAIHRLVGVREVRSVHLADWPVPDESAADQVLLDGMSQVQNLVELGGAARVSAGVGADRLLPQAFIGSQPAGAADYEVLAPFESLLARALGVARVVLGPEAATKVSWRLALNPDQTVERDITRTEVAAALVGLDQAMVLDLVSQLGAGLSASLQVAGQAITLLPDEVCISPQAQPGWAAAVGSGQLVVLELA